MAEVLFNNENITVFGPPETLDVQVDIGPAGARGSQFFVGVGNPNLIEIGQTPEVNDLYLNASPGGEYGYVYQYISQPGGNTWIQVLNITPTTYSVNYDVTFTAGSGQVVIPVSNIVTVTGTPLVADNFSIQYSILGADPTASSISGVSISGSNLIIDLDAIKYSGGSWSALAGTITVHLHITIVVD